MTLTTIERPTTRAPNTTAVTMKAFVYRGPGKKALEDHSKPEITAPTDAIVKIVKTTICGTDLHILKEMCIRDRGTLHLFGKMSASGPFADLVARSANAQSGPAAQKRSSDRNRVSASSDH